MPIKKISVTCPWCDQDFDSWQIGDFESDDETFLPSVGESQRCQHCSNHFLVSDIEVPRIRVAKGRSKEQENLDQQIAKDAWKQKVKELRNRYSTVKSPISWYCRVFGHSWECLAQSAYTDSLLFSPHKFLVCKNCMHVVDNLSENPENYGYWVK